MRLEPCAKLPYPRQLAVSTCRSPEASSLYLLVCLDHARGMATVERACSNAAIPFQLGLASYTLRNFDLDHALAMTRRVGLDRICLKSMHLPLGAKPDEITAAVEKVKRAGLTLYGGGVISMKNEREIAQAFEYAQAAGMQTITAAPVPEVLPILEQHVKKHEIRVAIHNHGPGDPYFPTPQSVYDAVKSLDPKIGLCIDIGHTVRVGADLLDSVRRCGDRLFDLHIKDVTAANAQGLGTPVGRGVIDFPGLVPHADRSQVQGCCRFRIRGATQGSTAGSRGVGRVFEGSSRRDFERVELNPLRVPGHVRNVVITHAR